MKLSLIITWRLLSLFLEETVSCMYIPSHTSDKGFNIVVGGGNFFNDTWFSELSDVELINPFWKNSVCEKPGSLPHKLDGLIGGNIGDKPIICGGLKTQSSDENGFEQTIVDDCHHLNSNEWSVHSHLKCPRWGAKSVMINKETMWVLGGNTDASSSDECVDAATSSEIYKSSHVAFEFSVALPEQMAYHCTARIDEHHIFVVNGYDQNYEGNSHAYIVDTSIEPFTFKPLPHLNKVRSEAACGCLLYTSPSPRDS